MSQIDFKFLECCLVHSKYCIDINYFLELWAGGERDEPIHSYAFGPVGKFLWHTVFLGS